MTLKTCGLVIVFAAACTGCLWLDVVNTTDYLPPVPKKDTKVDDPLADDALDDTRKPEFDASVVDRRPLGEWHLSASAAVTRLDIAPLKPDVEKELYTLHKDYASAMEACKDLALKEDRTLLPSVNLIDGKAKQFDDGLYAALDLAYFKGLEKHLTGHLELVHSLVKATNQNQETNAFLWQGLSAGGELQMPVRGSTVAFAAPPFAKEQFETDVLAKPIGFYSWSNELKACYRFMRHFQKTFPENSPVVQNILAAMRNDAALRADYRKVVTFYSRLTNPPSCRSYLDLLEPDSVDPKRAKQDVALFPPSTCKENVLFEKLFGSVTPPGTDFMKELIRRIRSGEVNLEPTKDSGWYEYQVYALETLLLPSKGEEGDRLQLTKAYKKRMEEAFKAMMTKKRETHVRAFVPFGMCAAPFPGMREPPKEVQPRLRVEPCPTYYVRQARAYAFLGNFLESFVGKEGLESLHGLKKDGQREPSLHAELQDMKDLFYGLYLVSAEDIGLMPRFHKDEPVDQERCYNKAEAWLEKAFADPDLKIDSRIAVPIAYDPVGKTTRLWTILGVRVDKLDASYARPPHIRPITPPAPPSKGGEKTPPSASGEAETLPPLTAGGAAAAWQLVEAKSLDTSKYYIAVDEFAEVEAKGVYTREEWQALCDRGRTKEGIVAELRKQGGKAAPRWFSWFAR